VEFFTSFFLHFITVRRVTDWDLFFRSVPPFMSVDSGEIAARPKGVPSRPFFFFSVHFRGGARFFLFFSFARRIPKLCPPLTLLTVPIGVPGAYSSRLCMSRQVGKPVPSFTLDMPFRRRQFSPFAFFSPVPLAVHQVRMIKVARPFPSPFSVNISTVAITLVGHSLLNGHR